MKSFFKKIALVLTLAMVIGLVPVNTASAAATPGLKYTSKILYIDGDASGKYDDWCWTPSQNTKGYDVSYNVKSGSNLIEVAKNGKITATGNGVGKAVVEVTYTSQNSGSSKTANFSVYVKKNASKVKLTNAVQKRLSQALSVGDEVTLKTAKTASDYKTGNYGLDNYTKVITDKMRVLSSDESIVKVEGFKLTAVAAGTATLTVQSYQTEGNLVTAEQEYQIVVEENFSAQQSAWNQILVTFKDHETANNAVEATKPSLNNAGAAVTEAKNIIKVYKVLKNTDNQEVSVFIGSLNVAVDSNVAAVTMFDELEEDTEYVIRYQEKETRIKTTKYVANELEVYVSGTEKLTESSSKSTLDYRIYTTGTQGQKVDISGCKGYEGWKAGVTIEDMNTAEYHAEYTFDQSTPAIWFYTAQANYGVRLKAIFDDWFNVVDGKANSLSDEVIITPGDTSVKIGSLLDWGVINTRGNYGVDDAYAVKSFAVSDDEYGLAVKIQVTEYGATSIKRNDGTSSDKFTFVSSNDDKLAVNKETGALYPPKDAADGIVPVYVYYDDQYVGVCPVRVYAKRTLTTFSASLNSSKLSYNPTKDVNDTLVLTLKASDQLGAIFNNNMLFEAEPYGDTAKNYITIDNQRADHNGTHFDISGLDSLPTSVTTIRIVCTATYDKGGKNERVMKYSVTLTAKNTKDSEVRSYSLVSNAADGIMDMIIDNNPNNSGNKVDAKKVRISAFSYDKDGFKVEHLQLATTEEEPKTLADSQAQVTLKKGNDIIKDNVSLDGKDIIFTTVTLSEIQVVSGGSIATLSDSIQKVELGTYVANLFIGNKENKAVFRASTPIVVKDSQPSVVWNWDKVSTVETTTGGAIDKCFTFKYDANGDGTLEIVNSSIYTGYVEKDKDGNYTGKIAYSDDWDLRGSKLTVRQVRYLVELDGHFYELIVPIMRTITMNVTQ